MPFVIMFFHCLISPSCSANGRLCIAVYLLQCLFSQTAADHLPCLFDIRRPACQVVAVAAQQWILCLPQKGKPLLSCSPTVQRFSIYLQPHWQISKFGQPASVCCIEAKTFWVSKCHLIAPVQYQADYFLYFMLVPLGKRHFQQECPRSLQTQRRKILCTYFWKPRHFCSRNQSE